MRNELNGGEKQKFLDEYFATRLQKIADLIKKPLLENREEHLSEIYDLLVSISDEFESVMLDKEEGYWHSLELWKDECEQRKALEVIRQLLSTS